MRAAPDWTKRVVALIKWGQGSHLEQLIQGSLYLNTPEFYRLSADKEFGDKYESCAYTYRKWRDEIGPVILKDGVPLSQFYLTSMTVYGATDQSFYLHCWSMVSAWDDARELKALIADLQKQREMLGPCFVALRARDIGTLLDRIKGIEPTAGCSHIEYSDNPNQQSCVCKRTRFSWQREFRFLVGQCAEKETTPRCLEVGDLSDLLLFNGTLDVAGETAGLSIGPDGVAILGVSETGDPDGLTQTLGAQEGEELQ
jgi:hypothetical protein